MQRSPTDGNDSHLTDRYAASNLSRDHQPTEPGLYPNPHVLRDCSLSTAAVPLPRPCSMHLPNRGGAGRRSPLYRAGGQHPSRSSRRRKPAALRWRATIPSVHAIRSSHRCHAVQADPTGQAPPPGCVQERGTPTRPRTHRCLAVPKCPEVSRPPVRQPPVRNPAPRWP